MSNPISATMTRATVAPTAELSPLTFWSFAREFSLLGCRNRQLREATPIPDTVLPSTGATARSASPRSHLRPRFPVSEEVSSRQSGGRVD
jgi:hypothetical protein